MTPMMEFSQPFNWCDRCCERCPLSPTCPVYERSERDRHLPFLEVLDTVLQEALASCALALGACFEGPCPPQLLSVEAQCVVAASWDYLVALRERGARDPSVLRLAVLVHGKIARVTGELDDVGGAVWQLDVVPNLLLLERVLDELQAAVAPPDERIAAREHTLRVLLAPMFDTIPSAARELMDLLAAWHRAPSPFARSCSSVRRTDTPC